MHAQWTPTYTVTFHPVGGSPAPVQQTVTEGGKVSEPTPPTRAVKGLFAGTVANVTTLTITFQGWYTDPAYTTTAWNFNNDTVTGTIDLYAKWSELVVDLDSQTGANILAKALNYINAQTLSPGTNYTIVLDEDCSMDGIYVANANITAANAVITLLGKVPTEISLSSNGSLFYISAGKLILDDNITLKGLTTNNSPLVYLTSSSASLRMKTGAKISGNSSSSVYGGGVSVNNSASFTMSGGKISGNSGNRGGGVSVVNNSSFSKTGNSVIYGDTNADPDDGNATDNTAKYGNSGGHAVYYFKDHGNSYYRDTTLNTGENISTETVPDYGTGSGWTKH
jgi:uncharacterized repeat protein (TIGR02543 family)